LFHQVPPGARHGIGQGLKLMLDVEEHEYSFYLRASKGFRLALSDSRDQPVIDHDGFYISTGIRSNDIY